MTWQIDTAHSSVSFSVRHMMISKVRGTFDSFEGTIAFDADNPTATAVDITIEASSVNTNHDERDGHLKSADFFNVENYPTLKFVSTRVEQSDANSGKLYGNLTILDTTKEVVLDIDYAGQAKSPWGTVSAGFSGSTTINRKAFGLEWNAALETGGVLVGDQIKIEIELELVQQPETAPAAA